MLGPDADIILAYHHQINTYGLEVTTEWVKGHQDEKEPTSALSDDAQLNTEMNPRATNGSTARHTTKIHILVAARCSS